MDFTECTDHQNRNIISIQNTKIIQLSYNIQQCIYYCN